MPAAAKASRKAQAAQSISEVQLPEQTPAEVRPPEEFVPRQPAKRLGPPEGMYSEGTELFSYTPKSTGVTIWFPMKWESPTQVQVWELYDKPFNVQSWEYMRWADVPRAMQRTAVELLDSSPIEYMELFEKWLKSVGGVTAGE